MGTSTGSAYGTGRSTCTGIGFSTYTGILRSTTIGTLLWMAIGTGIFTGTATCRSTLIGYATHRSGPPQTNHPTTYRANMNVTSNLRKPNR
uniref:Uncharacterized protein n=1 Tax=Anopheles epiroticus TaxID=199890 RepID=A0A182P889_9DIPT